MTFDFKLSFFLFKALLFSLFFFGLFWLSSSVVFSYKQEKTSLGVPKAWKKFPIEFSIHSSGMGDYFTDNPKRGEIGSEFTAIEKSFQTWQSIQCSNGPSKVLFQAMGKTSQATVGYDANCSACNTNLIQFVTNKADWTHDKTRVAVTTAVFDTQTGEIMDADIVVNMGHFEWSTQETQTDEMRYDLQSVITHEIGHILGLDHSDVKESTMFASISEKDTRLRSLHQDDVDGICAIYKKTTVGNTTTVPEYKQTTGDTGLGCISISRPIPLEAFFVVFFWVLWIFKFKKKGTLS